MTGRPRRTRAARGYSRSSSRSSRTCADASVRGSWGNTMRGAVRNKERWKWRRTPTQDPSTGNFRAIAGGGRPGGLPVGKGGRGRGGGAGTARACPGQACASLGRARAGLEGNGALRGGALGGVGRGLRELLWCLCCARGSQQPPLPAVTHRPLVSALGASGREWPGSMPAALRADTRADRGAGCTTGPALAIVMRPIEPAALALHCPGACEDHFGTDFSPLSFWRGPQTALNCSYRSDRVTRD